MEQTEVHDAEYYKKAFNNSLHNLYYEFDQICSGAKDLYGMNLMSTYNTSRWIIAYWTQQFTIEAGAWSDKFNHNGSRATYCPAITELPNVKLSRSYHDWTKTNMAGGFEQI